MTSVQLNQRNIDDVTEQMRAATIKAGRPIPISLDEFTIPKGQSSWQPIDDADRWRVEKIWPTYLSGGNIEFILGDLLRTESFKTPERDKLWDYLWNARKFVQDLPFHEMEPNDALITDTEEKNGIDAAGLRQAGRSLCHLSSDCNQDWFDRSYKSRWGVHIAVVQPATGQFEGNTVDIRAGAVASLPAPPSDQDSDWVALIRKITP